MNFRQFWRIFALSFHSPSLYLAVANNWKHWGLRYLLQLSIILSILYVTILFLIVFSFDPEKGRVAELLKQIPEIDISNKNATFVDENLNSIQNIQLKDTIFITIDFTIENPNNKHTTIFSFNKSKITMNFAGLREEIFYEEIAKTFKLSILDHQAWITLINYLKLKILPSLIILGITCGSLILFFISACSSLFYACFAKIILSFTKSDMDLKSLFRLANIAHGPEKLLSAIALIPIIFNKSSDLILTIASYSYLFYFVSSIVLNQRISSKNKH